jgi:beta-lactamase regulating signal transducer with metallopeptidase domain
MTAAWMLYILFVGTLLACGALAVDQFLRRRAGTTRWVWSAALGGIVVLGALAMRDVRAPDVASNLLQHVSAPQGVVAVEQGGFVAKIDMVRRIVATSIASGIAVVETRIPASLGLPLVVAWALLSAGILTVLVVVNRRVGRARKDWPVAELHGTSVRVAPVIGPAVIGLSRPEIIVPRWLLDRSDEEQRLVVVHEREHVAARDQIVLTGAWVVAALVPWHPAVWWMLSRLRLAIELDCDARVLHQGVHPRPYGALLIDIAGQCAGVRMGALALADKTTHLERRLLAMKPTSSRFSTVRTGALCAVAGLLVLVACESRMPTSAEVSKMDVASMEKSAHSLALFETTDGRPTIYVVDGVLTSAAAARAIDHSRIASIDITNGPDGNRISIKTGTPGTMIDSAGMHSIHASVKRLAGASDSTTPSTKAFTGLVMIDGVRSDVVALGKLAPANIESVEVIKGRAARAAYPDPASANGVIVVVTKTGAAKQ